MIHPRSTPAFPRGLRGASRCDGLGVAYTWHRSYAAGDKVYCLHEADDVDTIREHARRGNFPADLVVEVASEFGPQTAGS